MGKKDTKNLWVINYRLEGNIEVHADDADAAQDWFDNQFKNGMPRFVNDAEVMNDKPVKWSEVNS